MATAIFVDGALVATHPDNRGLVMTSAILEIGGREAIGGYVTGVIDELAIYDHVLSQDRITLHHTLGAP